MNLDVNPPSDELLHRVSCRASEVGRVVAEAVRSTGIPSNRYHLDNAGDDPFALDLAFHNCADLPYEAGIALAVTIQNALRSSGAEGWRLRLLVKPESEELVLDYVTWLVIDLLQVTELRGGRVVELFKSIASFRLACWGESAA